MKTIERRIIKDSNGSYLDQVRFLPLEDDEQNDGWRTCRISSVNPADRKENRK